MAAVSCLWPLLWLRQTYPLPGSRTGGVGDGRLPTGRPAWTRILVLLGYVKAPTPTPTPATVCSSSPAMALSSWTNSTYWGSVFLPEQWGLSHLFGVAAVRSHKRVWCFSRCGLTHHGRWSDGATLLLTAPTTVGLNYSEAIPCSFFFSSSHSFKEKVSDRQCHGFSASQPSLSSFLIKASRSSCCGSADHEPS